MDQAEQLRKLVRQQNAHKGCSRVITITSGKGGVGKSSTSVNLAVEMTRLGKKVVIFDADFGLANIEVMFGIRPKYNLADLMFHGRELKELVTQGPEGIGFISGGSGIQELTRLTREQIIYLSNKLVELDELADIIIIDTGAGISDNVLEFVTASSEVLLITTPEPTSITDAYALLKTLNKKEDFSKEDTTINIISNRVSNDSEGNDIYQKLSTVVDNFLNFHIDHLGNIPQDPLALKAVIQQSPVTMIYQNSPSAIAYKKLAAKLCDDVTDVQMQKKGISQLFTSLIKSKYIFKKH